jgi:hypothetical protein
VQGREDFLWHSNLHVDDAHRSNPHSLKAARQEHADCFAPIRSDATTHTLNACQEGWRDADDDLRRFTRHRAATAALRWCGVFHERIFRDAAASSQQRNRFGGRISRAREAALSLPDIVPLILTSVD